MTSRDYYNCECKGAREVVFDRIIIFNYVAFTYIYGKGGIMLFMIFVF